MEPQKKSILHNLRSVRQHRAPKPTNPLIPSSEKTHNESKDTNDSNFSDLEHESSPLSTSEIQGDQWLRQINSEPQDIRTYLQLLYKKCQYKNESLYGFNIHSLKLDLYKNDKKRVRIIWAMFKLFNWESVSIRTLCDYIYKFPSKQDKVQEIRLENGLLKIDKLTESLVIDITQGDYVLCNKTYELNRFHQRHYQRSLTKITTYGGSFQFEEQILQIESNETLLAVRTPQLIYVINPDNKMKKFNIKAHLVAVLQNRVYFALENGEIGTILMQTVYLPKLNQLEMERVEVKDTLMPGQLMVSGERDVFKVRFDLEESMICVKKLEKDNQVAQAIDLELDEEEYLNCFKAFYKHGDLHVVFLISENERITRMRHHTFIKI